MIGFRFYNYGCMLTCTFPFQVLCNALAPQTQQRQQRMMQQQMMQRMHLERMVQERLAETATDLILIMTRLSKLLSGVLDPAPRHPQPLPPV